jgi:thiol-disulfide isomerase/thioredoxin
MMHTRTVLKVALVVVAALIMVLTAYLVIMGLQANAKMSEIDDALSRGPVLVEFGAKWCYWCGLEEPVIANLSANFSSVTFLHVDSDENPKLADDFYVEGIPQMSIIVKKSADGSYLYVDPRGKTTTDRYASRLRGYMGYDDLAPLVESAIVARTNG